MTSQITDQLAAAKLNDAPSEANWKEGLTAPAKDARPQTEVRIGSRSRPCAHPTVLRDGGARAIEALWLFVRTYRLTRPVRM